MVLGALHSLRSVQIVALLSATDAMTSHTIEARHSYLAEDIVLNGQPHSVLRRQHGRLVVDYTCFRKRASGDLTLDDAKLNIETSSPMFMDSPGAAHGIAMQQAAADASAMSDGVGMGMPDEDALPDVDVRSTRSSVDAPLPSMGPSPRRPRRSESGRSRDLSRGPSWRRWDSEVALDLDHTSLPRLAIPYDEPGRRRSIAGVTATFPGSQASLCTMKAKQCHQPGIRGLWCEAIDTVLLVDILL